jgi:hypothetical protein
LLNIDAEALSHRRLQRQEAAFISIISLLMAWSALVNSIR